MVIGVEMLVVGFFVKLGLGSITSTQNVKGKQVCVLQDREEKGQGNEGMKKKWLGSVKTEICQCSIYFLVNWVFLTLLLFQAGQEIVLAGRKDCLLHILLTLWHAYHIFF